MRPLKNTVSASISSFRRKPESGIFGMFWIPDQIRNDRKKYFSKIAQCNEGDNFRKLKGIAGFTLLELLLVIFLLTLVLGISAAFSFSNVSSAKFDSMAREMTATMKKARLLAYMHNERQILTIDMDNRLYGIQGRKTRGIPSKLQITIHDTVKGEISKGQYSFVFSPSGRMEGGTIVMKSGKKEVKILTDPIVGSVLIRDK